MARSPSSISDSLLSFVEGSKDPRFSWAHVDHRGDGEFDLVVNRDVDDEAMAAALATGKVRALAGSAHLARYLVRANAPLPSVVSTVAIRKTEPDLLRALVGAAFTRDLQRLILVDDGACSIEPLLDASWPVLTMLGLHNVTAPVITALHRSPVLPQLATLRVNGAVAGLYQPAQAFALAPVFAALGEHVRELTFSRLHFDEDAQRAMSDQAWTAVEVLEMDSCWFDAAGEPLSSARFPALRRLDVSRRNLYEGLEIGDRAVASIVASAPLLEVLDATATHAGDLTAIAVASSGGCLESLELSHRVSDAGAIALARSTALTRLTHVDFTRHFGFDATYAMVESANPAIAKYARRELGPLENLRFWRPRWPAADAEREQRIAQLTRHTSSVETAIEAVGSDWPSPRLERWFGWQRIERCELCRGTGVCPDGYCPMHSNTVVHPEERARIPPDVPGVRWVATHAKQIHVVEGHAARFFDALTNWPCGSVARAIEWWLGPEEHEQASDRVPAALADACAVLGPVQHLDTGAWAHACARVPSDRPDLFGPARAMLEAGVRIVKLDTSGLLVEPACLRAR